MKATPETNKQETFGIWDPWGENIKKNVLLKKRNQYNRQFDQYKQNPKKLYNNYKIFRICGWLNLILVVPVIIIFKKIFPEGSGFFSLLVLIFCVSWIGFFLQASSYKIIIKNLEKIILNHFIAQKNKWIYKEFAERNDKRNQSSSNYRWRKMSKAFPDFFGTTSCGLIMHEFWGKLKTKNKEFDFWTANYSSIWGGKENFLKIPYSGQVFAFRLNKKLKNSFVIESEKFIDNFKFFQKKIFSQESKEIEVESSAFNKNFCFYYNKKKVITKISL